jgi:hypothetical protein
VFENKVLKIIYGYRKENIVGRFTTLCNDEIHDFDG